MRILQVAPHYHPCTGGVERHVQAISERLAGLGHQVEVATLAPSGWRPSSAVVGGVSVRRFPSVGPGPAYRLPVGLFSYLARSGGGFDVAHVHNYHGGLTPLVAAARPAARLVVTPHLNDRAHSCLAEALHWPFAPLGRWSLRQADAVVCVSAAERARLTAASGRFRLPPECTLVIPNGVDSLVSAGPGRPRDGRLLLVVGRLEAYKRVDRVIEALAALPPAYRLVIVGQGPLRASLERDVVRWGLAARVAFVGRVSDAELGEWYRRAAALISLSSAEAFGLSVVEAVAAGCRVICSPIPAFQELAQRFPGRVQVVPDVKPLSVVVAVESLVDDGTTAAAPLDLADLSWDAVTGRLVELYRRLLEQPSAPGLARPARPEVVPGGSEAS